MIEKKSYPMKKEISESKKQGESLDLYQNKSKEDNMAQKELWEHPVMRGQGGSSQAKDKGLGCR